jgi:outer membrane receptor protein involved in Fe transport
MRRENRRTLSTVVSVIACMVSIGWASAHDSGPGAPQAVPVSAVPPTGPESPPAAAGGGGDSADGKLAEVVVSAEKRVERVQDVPISLQVVNSDALTGFNKNSLEEVSQSIPGLHVVSRANSNLLTIRGVGSGENLGFDQSVAQFTDDVYHGRSRMSQAAFLDLDRVEVLKGPQSTFFGNNAIAGALNIISKKPTDHFEAWGRALYGMFGQYAAEGAVNVPVTDTFAVRLALTENGFTRGRSLAVQILAAAPRVGFS